MFASKSTRGFYDAAIHGDNMPDDVVEITAEEHAELLDGQSNGKLIDFDEVGRPFLAEPPVPTAEQVQVQANAEARAYLISTDWYVIRLQETGQAVPEDIRTARAEARASVVDIPSGV